MDILTFLIVLFYALFLVIVFRDFHKSSLLNKELKSIPLSDVTWLVPFKNELNTIPEFLNSLKSQKDWKLLSQIIFIDDNSTDGGSILIEEFIRQHESRNIELIRLKDLNSSKKRAIQKGIENIKNSWILQSDMDISFGPGWLRERLKIGSSALLSIAPISYKSDKFLSEFLNIENWALQAITAFCINRKIPQMANGANLLWYKSLVDEKDTFREGITSGDDTDLMNAAFRKSEDALEFSFKSKAIINTYAPVSLKSFYYQRLRWTSKFKNSKFSFQLLFAAVIWFFHLIYASAMIYSILDYQYAYAFTIFLTKALAEFYLLNGIANHYGSRISIFPFIMSLLFYSPYVVFFGLFGQFVNPKWK